MDNMTKEALKVWKLVKSRMAEHQEQLDVADEQDEASVNAAAVAATLAESPPTMTVSALLNMWRKGFPGKVNLQEL